jgi:hypothetical protein
VSGGDGAAIDGKGETTEVDDTTPQDDMQDRQELIPPDLAPRITQMVVDDLRAAGWTVEPPTQGLGEVVASVDDWYVNRRDSYRSAKRNPCLHPRVRRSASFDGHLICLSCGENLDLSGS